jgi:hypothetical protein
MALTVDMLRLTGDPLVRMNWSFRHLTAPRRATSFRTLVHTRRWMARAKPRA